MKLAPLVALLLAAPLSAGAAEFPDRVVMKIGATPASSFNTIGRVVAAHIGRFLPGEPNIEVEVVEGARGMQLTRQLVETEPHDGSVVGILSTSGIQNYVLNPSGFEFSLADLQWVGTFADTVNYCVKKKDSDISLSDDDLVLGASSKSSTFYENAAILKRLINPNVSIAVGFQNENELVAALDRGEINAYCGPTRSTYEREGRASLQDILGGFGDPDTLAALGVSNILEPVSDEDKEAVTLASALDRLFVALVLPSGTDADTVSVYRQAFADLNKDATFIAEIKAKLIEYAPMSGQDMEKLVKQLLAADPAVAARALELFE